jgi:hypothetical protein
MRLIDLLKKDAERGVEFRGNLSPAVCGHAHLIRIFASLRQEKWRSIRPFTLVHASTYEFRGFPKMKRSKP